MFILCHIRSEIPSVSHAMWVLRRRVMNYIEIPYHVTWSMRMDETRVTRRRVFENIVENEELREHEERRDIF